MAERWCVSYINSVRAGENNKRLDLLQIFLPTIYKLYAEYENDTAYIIAHVIHLKMNKIFMNICSEWVLRISQIKTTYTEFYFRINKRKS